MTNYTPFLQSLSNNGNDMDDYWENFDCTHRFLIKTNPAYVAADLDCIHKTAVLFDELNTAQTAIVEVHFYLVTDFIELGNRFYYAFGQTLALLEWFSPQDVDAFLQTLDEKREAFDSSPVAVTTRRQAKISYHRLSSLYVGLHRQTQLAETLAAYQKSKQVTESFLPFAGYAAQRLRQLGCVPNRTTPLAESLIAYYENSR